MTDEAYEIPTDADVRLALREAKDTLWACGTAMKMATARITMLEEVLEFLSEQDWFKSESPAGKAAIRAIASRAPLIRES